jgi:hypothetical protein
MVPIMVLSVLALSHGRVLRCLMLVLGVLSAPSIGVETLQRPHCSQHEHASHHHGYGSASMDAHGPDSATWTQAHDHRCPHCPATECARVSPCSGSTSSALTPADVAVTDITAHRVAVDLASTQAVSAVSQPDTPPPQLIA